MCCSLVYYLYMVISASQIKKQLYSQKQIHKAESKIHFLTIADRILPESFHWLLANGKSTEAQKLLCRAARMNKVNVSEEQISHFVNDNNVRHPCHLICPSFFTPCCSRPIGVVLCRHFSTTNSAKCVLFRTKEILQVRTLGLCCSINLL